MALKSPNAVDVQDIQFKLYAKTKILNLSESIPNNLSLLTTSSARGLLFVGEPEKPELKVFMLNNLIDTENICNEILARAVQLPGVPNIIVGSCDGSMLAVSYTQNGSSFLQIFSVATFLTSNIQTLHTIKLAADENVAALQILWNPVIAGNLAIVLSNGALGMYNLKDGGQYEMHCLDKSQQVQCGCWSPKGKQIVLGFANGKLQQLKPDLTPAKTIACPTGVHAGPFSTIAVHWLSTFQFAVAFVQDGEGMVPSLYIVNAPKGGTPSYINYFDVCYTTGQRVNQMSFVHVQQWNLLLVLSANGIEVGLLGCKETGDNPTWIQYTLLDEARIEMPLTESKDETFPIGFAFDTSCTHHLTVNDKELPTMPMVHVLTTIGQLLSFNFLNLTPGAPDVCSPPPPISYNTQQFRPLEEHLKTETVEVVAAAAAPPTQFEKASNGVPSGLVASTPVMKDKAPTCFGNSDASGAQQSFEGNIVGANQATKTIFSGFGGLGGLAAPTSGLSSIGTLGGQQQKLDQQQSTQAKPQSQPHLQQQQQQQHQQQQQQQQQQLQKPQQFSTVAVSGVKSSELNKPLYTVPANFTPPTIGTIAQQSQPQKSQSNTTISSKMQSGFLELIVVQINAFDKEIKQLGAQSKGLLKNLGNPDEMRGCSKRLNDLQEITEQANDHEFEMDVQNLRHFLTETRAMIAECRWKLEKHNNPELPRVGNNTSDPVNRRQLVKLQSYLATNEAQMQVLKLQIDSQWSNFQDSVRRNTKSQIHIPCLDGIYQRMTKLQESLSRHRQKLNQIKLKLQQNGLLYKITNADTSRSHVNVDSTIDSLADSILSITLAPVVDEHRSKLSTEKLDAIKKFTRQRRTVNIIKPQRPNRVGLKSEVVLETMLQSERNKARENNAKIEQKQRQEKTETQKQPQNTQQHSQSLSKDSNLTGFLKTEDTSKPLSIPNQQTLLKTSVSSPAFTFNVASSNNIMKSTTPVEKDEKPAPFSFNFKTPLPNLSGFGKPLEISKGVPTTPEDEVPGTAQIPISFAAKVIGGTTITTNSSGTAGTNVAGIGLSNTTITTTDKGSKVSEETSKPFSFTAGLSNSNNIFGGIGTDAMKPQGFDLKTGTGLTANFSFGGFTSTAANTTVSTTMPAVVSLSTVPTTMNVTPTDIQKPSFLSGFGKPTSVDSNATPLNLSPAVSTSSFTAQSLTKSAPVSAPITSIVSSSVSSDSFGTVSSTTVSTATTDPTDSLFGSLNICKPTSKPSDLSKSPSSTSNIFAGVAASSEFSFTPVPGAAGNIAFGDLTKSLSTNATLTITPVTTAIPTTTMASTITTTKNISTTTTTATQSAASITTATTTPAKPTDFTFSLGSLGTTITTATTTTSLPTATNSTTITTTSGTSSVATSLFSSTAATTIATSVPSGIFASAAFPVAASTAPSSTPSIFGGVSGGTGGGATFFTSATATPTATTTSAGGSIFGTVTSTSMTTNFTGFNIGTTASTGSTSSASVSGGSLFASTNAGGTSPPSNNIFGGIPKPDQSVFGSAATQTQPSGGNLFASAAPNASPFAAAAISPPPNQTVGGSIFGGPSDAFSKPAGSIFGGNATTATSANAIGSPFGLEASGASIFGSSAVKPAEGGSIFSGATLQPAAAAGGGGAGGGGSIFAQNSFGQLGAGTTPSSNLFGSGASGATQPAFGTGGSIFGGNATTTTSASSGGSIFGGVANQSTFGSPSNATGASGFGAFSQTNTASPFGSPGPAASGPFGQGGASVAQTGFGSPQQTSAFSKPVFGGPPTFGSPPAFGAQPTFGGAPTFGSQKGFGSFASPAPASPPSGVFGGGAQKNNLFETLGSTDAGLSFGNLAQGANATGPKPPFGGSSFTSYRS